MPKPNGLIEYLDGLLHPSRTTVYPLVVLVMWPVIWAVTLGAGEKPILIDFVARWTGGLLAHSGDVHGLYDPARQVEVQHELFADADGMSWFVSPPFEALVLVPLGALPFPVAAFLWTLLSMASWVASLLLLRNILAVSIKDWRRFVIIAMASLPFLEVAFAGQNTTFILLWLTLCLRAQMAGKQFLAGVFLGLALVKPHLVLLIPVLWLLERRWRALAGVSAVFGVWVVVSVGVFGPFALRVWIQTLLSGAFFSEVHIGQALKHAGLSGLLTAILSGAAFEGAVVALLLSVAVGCVVVFMIWRRQASLSLKWWLVVMVSVAIAPHAMVYDLILLVPGVALALRRWWVPSLRVVVAICWVSLWLYPVLVRGLWQLGTSPGFIAAPWHSVPIFFFVALVVQRLGSEASCVPRVNVSRADLKRMRHAA